MMKKILTAFFFIFSMTTLYANSNASSYPIPIDLSLDISDISYLERVKFSIPSNRYKMFAPENRYSHNYDTFVKFVPSVNFKQHTAYTERVIVKHHTTNSSEILMYFDLKVYHHGSIKDVFICSIKNVTVISDNFNVKLGSALGDTDHIYCYLFKLTVAKKT